MIIGSILLALLAGVAFYQPARKKKTEAVALHKSSAEDAARCFVLYLLMHIAQWVLMSGSAILAFGQSGVNNHAIMIFSMALVFGSALYVWLDWLDRFTSHAILTEGRS